MPIVLVKQGKPSASTSQMIQVADSYPEIGQETPDFVHIAWFATPAVFLTVLFAISFLARKNGIRQWAKTQVLSHHAQSLRPIRWVVSVLFVIIVSALFDKLDISELSDLNATAHDIVFLNGFTLAAFAYLYGLFFIWDIENDIDDKLSKSEKQRLLALATAQQSRQEVDCERRISQLSNRILGERWDRVRAVLNDDNSVITTNELIQSMQPETQLLLILTSIHQFVSLYFKDGLPTHHQLRVAYYVPVDGHLKPIISYDGSKSNCIKTPSTQFRDRFELTHSKARDCLAVHCSLMGSLDPILIPDTDKANDDPASPYRHFSDDQSTHIKSIAGYCCKRANGDEPPHSVLTLDCSLKDFFNDDEVSKLSLRRMLDDLTLRLAYECDLFDLVQNAKEYANRTEVDA